MALTDLTRLSTSGIATGTSLSGAILHGDAHFRGDQVGINSALFDSSERRLDFKDDVKLRFGDSGDLSLSHNGSDSIISHSAPAAGHLRIFSGGVESIKCIKAGAVNILHNGSTKIQTTSTGTVVTGVLTATSFSGPIVGHTNNTSGISTFYDLRVSNNLTVEGTTTTLDTNLVGVDRIEVGANSNTIVGVAITQSGTADIFNLYDGSTEVFSVADGGNITATGSLDLGGSLYWDGDTNTTIDNAGGTADFIRFKTGGSTVMDINASQNILIHDDRQLIIGGGSDLKLYHSSSANVSYVTSTTNDVIHAFNVAKNWTLQTTAADKRIHCPGSGTSTAVELYFGGNKKFETLTGGAKVTGQLDLESAGSYIKSNQLKFNPSGAAYIDHGVTGQSLNFRMSNSSSLDTTAITIASDGTTTATGTSDGVLQLDTSDSRGAFIRFGQGGSYHHMIGCADGLVAGPDKEDLGLRAKDNMVFCTNGASERVRIDSHGCVRVGNTATQTTSGNTKRIALGAKGSIQGWVSGQLNGHIQMIDNYYWDGSNNKAIEADHCAYLSLRSGTLRFGSTNSSQTAGQNVSGGIHERLRIGADGNLALGGTNTSAYTGHTNFFIGGMANLYAETTAASSASFSLSNNAYINSSGNWVYRTGGKSTNMYQYDGSIGFRTAASGSAGGTISWKERLTIGHDQNIYIWGNETGNNRAILYNGSGYFGIYGSSSNSVDRQLRFHTGGGSASEKMRISSDGFFLVNCQDTGFSSGYTDMTIGNTSASSTGLTIASHPTNGLSRLHFADGNSGAARYAGWIVYDHSVDGFLISTGNSGSEKLRIDSNGSLNFNYTNGGAYSSGGARNVIDLGSGTLNRGMGWGGTNANYANIWTEYSSGALHLGMGIRPTGTSTGWVSSYGSGSIGRSALKMDLNGNITMYTGENSTVAAGGATNLTQKWFLHKQGGITHQFAGRNGNIIGSTDGSGAYLMLDGEGGSPISSGSDYMYMEHTSTGQFEMWNGKTGVTVSKFMDVSPEGWINTPKQPHCSVTLDTNRTVSNNGVHRFHVTDGFGGHYFTAVNANIGSHYDSSNSRFTVPVTGRYLITMNLAVTGSSFNAYGAWEWWINGARGWLGGWQRSDASGYHRLTSSTVLSLTKDDYLEPGYELHQAVTCLGSNNAWEYTGFTITLLT